MTACIRYRGRQAGAGTVVFRDSGDLLDLRELEDAVRTHDRDNMVRVEMLNVGKEGVINRYPSRCGVSTGVL